MTPPHLDLLRRAARHLGAGGAPSHPVVTAAHRAQQAWSTLHPYPPAPAVVSTTNGTPEEPTEPAPTEPDFLPACDHVGLGQLQPETIQWLWPGRLPVGKLVLLEGDPGLGKSTLALDLAARLTRGAPWPRPPAEGAALPEPLSHAPLGHILICSAEDGPEDTILPRFLAADGQVEHATLIRGVRTERGVDALSLPDHIQALKNLLVTLDAQGADTFRLLIIDPIVAYLAGSIDTHKDHSVRRALHPLADFAQEFALTVLVIRHLNKGSGPALYRGGGSIGMTGAARMVLLVGEDPQDEREVPPSQKRRLFAVVKSNLAAIPTTLSFTLEDTGTAARVAYGDSSQLSADQIVSSHVNGEEKGALHEAVGFLKEQLTYGPRTYKELLQSARAEGIAERTLYRARTRLGVVSAPTGFHGPHLLRLPDVAKSNYSETSSSFEIPRLGQEVATMASLPELATSGHLWPSVEPAPPISEPPTLSQKTHTLPEIDRDSHKKLLERSRPSLGSKDIHIEETPKPEAEIPIKSHSGTESEADRKTRTTLADLIVGRPDLSRDQLLNQVPFAQQSRAAPILDGLLAAARDPRAPAKTS